MTQPRGGADLLRQQENPLLTAAYASGCETYTVLQLPVLVHGSLIWAYAFEDEVLGFA